MIGARSHVVGVTQLLATPHQPLSCAVHVVGKLLEVRHRQHSMTAKTQHKGQLEEEEAGPPCLSAQLGA